MRILLTIWAICLLTACSSHKSPPIERDIFIVPLDTGFDVSGRIMLKDTANAIRFSKDFWNYFFRTHPRSCGMIFIAPLYDTSNNYVSLHDTAYTFYHPTRMDSFYFNELLADTAGGHEEDPLYGGGFFIVRKDTTGMAAEEDSVARSLKDYQVTPAASAEFKRFKDILVRKDSTEDYIIIFRKDHIGQYLQAL